MQVFLKRLSQHRERLSQLEMGVLEFILHHHEIVVQMNVDELAKKLFVSTATISRTCQQLGFRGFQDFKYSLKKEVTKEPHNTVFSHSGFLSSHIDRVKQEIESTFDYIDEGKIIEAAKYIHASKHVEFFGVGNSLPPCVDASRKLMFAGKISSAREDWDELRSVANSLSEDDLAILVSYSGETLYTLEYASLLKKRNVKTISITGQHNNRLQQEVDLSFQAHVINCYYGDMDMSSRFPLSIILDLIILTYLEQYKDS
ncbi:MurR/RpiR family transcriptional regulator [Peribacillus muralis]|uniref:MurR/RpiR family transcriptional regulator n=1 Tax=Peribacillus muralis TaxID=264697 RepID=UPI001F4DC7EB|nr:MurR/RpiR family transcriptional regulator [Peribacillus muralis]MCK1993664.1 MurR/RpiR family transcriptional regulator [Peribacillus muralis]MCK2014048.1 MurR/RpiR family transcriptional regulator [Peribacillus muralis]